MKKDIPENELQDLQALSGMRSSTQNMCFQIARFAWGEDPEKSQRREKRYSGKLSAGPTSITQSLRGSIHSMSARE